MKTNMEPKNTASNTVSNGWENISEMAQTERAMEQAANFYKSALEVEKDFIHRKQAIDAEYNEMSQEEFEKWEDALSDEIHYARKELEDTDETLETVAECEQAMTFPANNAEIKNTIEAQAGNFYHKRIDALRQAIETSNNKDAKKDLADIKNFYNAAMIHLDYLYVTPDEIESMGFKEYQDNRELAHNTVIKRLNDLNDLAREYHVRPFTNRNFCPSDTRKEKDQTPAVSSVMKHDRAIVKAYYFTAFSSEVRRKENELQRRIRYGIF